jgi:hypothetical protein
MHRKDARVFGRTLSILALFAAAFALTGCSGATRIDGRVVTGPVGLAVVVDPTDERLSNPGVGGVEVALLRETSSNSGSLITRTVTDEHGDFRFTLARGHHPGAAVIVRTRGDGIYTSRSRTYLPRGNQKLLCTVMAQPEASAPSSEPASPSR